jgi:hypothetical protein
MTRDDERARKRTATNRVSRVRAILRRWDPIAVAPGELAPCDECDGYAPRIVSMVVQGCSMERLRTHLGVIGVGMMGREPNPARNREIAGEVIEAIGPNKIRGSQTEARSASDPLAEDTF